VLKADAATMASRLNGLEAIKVTTATSSMGGAVQHAISGLRLASAGECRDLRHFPPGFDEIDIAVLHWIAAEARRAGRTGRGFARL
jgi:hypothetical protein